MKTFHKILIITTILLITTAFLPGVCLAIEDNAQQKEASVGMDVDMLSDVLNYFPDNDTIVAEGNAQIRVKGQNTVLQADKITFHRDTQIVVAEQNVKIIKNQMTMSGSYIKMDLSKESALVDHPVTQIAMIHIQARDATLYSDNIEALKGNAQVSEKMNLVLASSSFDQFHDTKQEMIDSIVENADYKRRTQYKIKTKEMIIKADEYKNNITLKTADVYVGKRKIATIPSITISTDKSFAEMETMLPEFGQTQQTGMFMGPSQLFNLPFGTTMKASPVIAFDTSKFGAGGMVRLRNSHNRTLLGYTSVKSLFILAGEQDLIGDDTKLRYTANSYVNDWFLGDRLPEYSVEVVYKHPDIKVQDLGITVRQRYAAGYMADSRNDWRINSTNQQNLPDSGDGDGQLRFKAQGEVYKTKPIFTWRNMKFNWTGQYDLTAYGKGDVATVVRTGPNLIYKAKRFKLNLNYFLSGIGGKSPFVFDQYYYGRSNLSGVMEYKINKYVSVGYYGSANLSKDNWDHRLIAENRLYTKIGPEDFKLCFGYDTVRRRTLMDVNMLIGSENSNIEFEKMRVIDPEKLEKPKKKSFWESVWPRKKKRVKADL